MLWWVTTLDALVVRSIPCGRLEKEGIREIADLLGSEVRRRTRLGGLVCSGRR